MLKVGECIDSLNSSELSLAHLFGIRCCRDWLPTLRGQHQKHWLLLSISVTNPTCNVAGAAVEQERLTGICVSERILYLESHLPLSFMLQAYLCWHNSWGNKEFQYFRVQWREWYFCSIKLCEAWNCIPKSDTIRFQKTCWFLIAVVHHWIFGIISFWFCFASSPQLAECGKTTCLQSMALCSWWTVQIMKDCLNQKRNLMWV